MFMPNIHTQQETKSRLDNAVKVYCQDKDIPNHLCEKISYDFIINQILDKVGL